MSSPLQLEKGFFVEMTEMKMKNKKTLTPRQKRLVAIRQRGKAKGREEFEGLGLECTRESGVADYRRREELERERLSRVYDLVKAASLVHTFAGMVKGPDDLVREVGKRVNALIRSIDDLKEFLREEVDAVGKQYHRRLRENWEQGLADETEAAR